MSIIHEALRKAERDREVLPRGIPMRRAGQLAGGRWLGLTPLSVLIGVVGLSAISTWIWLMPLGSFVTSDGPTSPTPALSQDSQQTQQWAAVSFNTRAFEQLPSMHRADAETTVFASTTAKQPPPAPPQPARRTMPFAATHSAAHLETHAAAAAAFERGMKMEATEQWEEAVRHYRQAITLNPTLVEARNNLGNLYVRQNLIGAAIEQFRAAIAVKPDYAVGRNNLGSAYLMAGDDAAAVQEFLAALREDAAYATPYYNLASVYARRGDGQQAIAFLTKAIALQPAALSWLQEDPDFDGIRATPELQRLIAPSHTRR